MRRIIFILLCPVLALPACVSHSAASKGPAESPWTSPPLEHVVSVRDGRTGERIEFEAMLDRLAEFDAVFLGETHTDEMTHRVEFETYAGLLARRGGRVVLAMEMFDRDVQRVLDAYLDGEVDEAHFLAQARPWSNYRTAYRPMIELAKRRNVPVVAANFPAPLRRKVSSEGLDALTAEEREHAPGYLLANTPEYWRRVDNAVRGHAGMMGPAPGADDPRLNSVQSLWDNSMGEACALALRRHPGHAVVHVNGGFHTEYWDGTARQLRLREPDASIATVAIVPSASPFAEELSGAPMADFVVYAEARAEDFSGGTYSVFVPRKLEYALHVPSTASDERRVPLLTWLADDGESTDDVMALWRARIGDECAIVVVTPPYREMQDDLVPGGRWYWADSFAHDVYALRAGIERAIEYVERHQPVDGARACVAGEGTGATLAAAFALLSDGSDVRALAFEPRQYRKIADFPLPLPELRGDDPATQRSLRVVVRDDARPEDAEGWSKELAQYRDVGIDADALPSDGDAWTAQLVRENTVREAVGLVARAVPSDAARAHVHIEGSRARSWARRLADARARDDGTLVALLPVDGSEASAPSGSSEIQLAIRAADFAEPGRLPKAAGAFGGSTVVVLTADATAEEIDAWRALQAADPLAQASRFQRLVVADASGERALDGVLSELLAQKRMNVLIVPAVWCADGATMRALQASARAFEDRMTLQWRPGLGGL